MCMYWYRVTQSVSEDCQPSPDAADNVMAVNNDADASLVMPQESDVEPDDDGNSSPTVAVSS